MFKVDREARRLKRIEGRLTSTNETGQHYIHKAKIRQSVHETNDAKQGQISTHKDANHAGTGMPNTLSTLKAQTEN